MCNAKNHRAYCPCAFGPRAGPGTDQRFPASGDLFSVSTPHRVTSYSHPNATCPVCGVAVFFYQSEHGGRVFFDELGPPWPKHPCTDSSLATTGTPGTPRDGRRTFDWEAAGWGPIDGLAATVDPKGVVQITGSWKGRSVCLRMDVHAFDGVVDVVGHVENFPLHVREREGGQFDVMWLSPDLTPRATSADVCPES